MLPLVANKENNKKTQAFSVAIGSANADFLIGGTWLLEVSERVNTCPLPVK
jgi:hypothetical protein